MALDVLAETDPTEFSVEAADDPLGTVDRRSLVPEFDHLVVDTGTWKFGRSTAIPMGMVARIDAERRVITLLCTKEQVKGAPRFARDHDTNDPAYLTRLGSYYAGILTP
ncbi:PRC-barrel domain containing protein [Streptomyces sp. AM 2-1-1]|uniref:PRC-barrel domain containing protein n=1 Tax=Streptomyces sp. AM 2-1-1 TaxID=3028709 RepID=UPI0023B8FDAA|nr:PRC-barrel domain containing protein [Streptomyces sp. AM 2-1-1]WEH38460.1 PRC-barrel domain containing protein [Streptomyces sp. AM 2-1-1]